MLNSGISFERLFVRSSLSVVTFLFAAGAHAIADKTRCELLLTAESPTRGYTVEEINWKNDKSYIKGGQTSGSLGIVQTYFSKKWDTQVYHTATGLPDSKGRAPLVDPNSKAVFLFFHGSGTMKSSGKNFVANMNTLANLGYSAVSVDMPFHADGPRTENMYQSNVFMEWIRNIVLEVKKSKKRVILAGHSFGPDVLLEFITRYPKSADGAVALSPASFNKELKKWYEEKTSKMKFGGAEVSPNDDGGLWAYRVSEQFLWSTGKLADPTKVNSDLVVRILSGNMEEYVPGPLSETTGLPSGPNTYDVTVPLRKVFSKADIVIEPGIGHYLFDHLDANGVNVVTRELLAAVKVNPKDIKKIMDETKQEAKNYAMSEQLSLKYSQDSIFRSWANHTYGDGKIPMISRQQNDPLAKKIMDEFVIAQKARDMEIYAKVQDTKNTHPEFYKKYKTNIDKMNPKVLDSTLFVPYLKEVLNAQ